jgi:hypothetical protein
MPLAATQWVTLVGDPASRSDAMRGIDVRVRRAEPDTLAFQYVLRAEMPHIRVPASRPAARTDELWKHTCFEAFIAAAGTRGYYELNFSPSQQWAIYRFDAYREGRSPSDVTLPPRLAVRRFDDRLELDATLRLPDLTALQAARALKLALSVVVEHDSGTLSYWALKHAPGKPDFHHSDGFVLELPL